MKRMWINQPSTLQPHHALHAVNVLAAPEPGSDTLMRVWFLSGPIVSQQMMRLALSDGWLEYPVVPVEKESIEWTRIDNDGNGNPRYVCHFMVFNTAAEKAASGEHYVHNKYDLALARARKIGGRKFNNKRYGGGIVFQCYGGADMQPHIDRIMSAAEKTV